MQEEREEKPETREEEDVEGHLRFGPEEPGLRFGPDDPGASRADQGAEDEDEDVQAHLRFGPEEFGQRNH
jgi:hypothetical protein